MTFFTFVVAVAGPRAMMQQINCHSLARWQLLYWKHQRLVGECCPTSTYLLHYVQTCVRRRTYDDQPQTLCDEIDVRSADS